MKIERLTPQEENVMNAFWDTNASTIKEIITTLEPTAPPYTTVASIVRNLEAKGYLRGTHEGKRYIYEILISRSDYSEYSMGRLVGQFFTGSYRALVQHFVNKEKLTKQELREILDLIDEAPNADETN